MIYKLASNSVYDSHTTRIMFFKFLSALYDAAEEFGEDSYIFDQDDLKKEKIGNFQIKTVQGKDEDIDFYLEPKSLSGDAAAKMFTKRENNGKMAISIGIQDDISIGELIDKLRDQDFFNSIFTSLAHEITHTREAEAKPRAYSQEEDKRLKDLKIDKDKYVQEYTNSEVEFEALLTSSISSIESEFLGTIIKSKKNKKLMQTMMENIDSGKMFSMISKNLIKIFSKMADKFKWPEAKRRKAYSKVYSSSRKIVNDLREFIEKHAK